MNIVFCAYAYKKEYQQGHNIQYEDAQNVYLKNSFVALCSCKYYNPDTEVALVTNLELNQYWKNLYLEKGIKIFNVEFENYVFPKEYGWSLAFYKLCALKHVLTLNYDNIVLIDTDTYTQRTYHDIWRECQDNILLYDISRGLYNVDYKLFCEEAKDFLKCDEFITRWGGEFIAGNKKRLLEFEKQCDLIYQKMYMEKFVTINGDEFIISIAAWQMRDQIKNGAAYIFRYWTAFRWHYVCSNYNSNPVAILHCPREKDHGFVQLFTYITNKKKIPSAKKVYRKLNLDTLGYIRIELIKNLLKLKNK